MRLMCELSAVRDARDRGRPKSSRALSLLGCFRSQLAVSACGCTDADDHDLVDREIARANVVHVVAHGQLAMGSVDSGSYAVRLEPAG